jgi:hypothetical protein
MPGSEHLRVKVVAWDATGDDVTKLYIGCDDPTLPDKWWESEGCIELVNRLLKDDRFALGEPYESAYKQPVDHFIDFEGGPGLTLEPEHIYPYMWEVRRALVNQTEARNA